MDAVLQILLERVQSPFILDWVLWVLPQRSLIRLCHRLKDQNNSIGNWVMKLSDNVAIKYGPALSRVKPRRRRMPIGILTPALSASHEFIATCKTSLIYIGEPSGTYLWNISPAERWTALTLTIMPPRIWLTALQISLFTFKRLKLLTYRQAPSGVGSPRGIFGGKMAQK